MARRNDFERLCSLAAGRGRFLNNEEVLTLISGLRVLSMDCESLVKSAHEYLAATGDPEITAPMASSVILKGDPPTARKQMVTDAQALLHTSSKFGLVKEKATT